jgi:hypothetical protein
MASGLGGSQSTQCLQISHQIMDVGIGVLAEEIDMCVNR